MTFQTGRGSKIQVQAVRSNSSCPRIDSYTLDPVARTLVLDRKFDIPHFDDNYSFEIVYLP